MIYTSLLLECEDHINIRTIYIVNSHIQIALIVSPPCFVTRGRVEIFTGRLVNGLSVDFVAQRNASPGISEDKSVEVKDAN